MEKNQAYIFLMIALAMDALSWFLPPIKPKCFALPIFFRFCIVYFYKKTDACMQTDFTNALMQDEVSDFLPLEGTDYVEFYVAMPNKRHTITNRPLVFRHLPMPVPKQASEIK